MSKVKTAKAFNSGNMSSDSGLLAMLMKKTFAKVYTIVFSNPLHSLLLFFTEDQIIYFLNVCLLSIMYTFLFAFSWLSHVSNSIHGIGFGGVKQIALGLILLEGIYIVLFWYSTKNV